MVCWTGQHVNVRDSVQLIHLSWVTVKAMIVLMVRTMMAGVKESEKLLAQVQAVFVCRPTLH